MMERPEHVVEISDHRKPSDIAAFLWAGWLTNWSFELGDIDAVREERDRKAYVGCILNNKKDVNDRLAAIAIRQACGTKWNQ